MSFLKSPTTNYTYEVDLPMSNTFIIYKHIISRIETMLSCLCLQQKKYIYYNIARFSFSSVPKLFVNFVKNIFYLTLTLDGAYCSETTLISLSKLPVFLFICDIFIIVRYIEGLFSYNNRRFLSFDLSSSMLCLDV